MQSFYSVDIDTGDIVLPKNASLYPTAKEFCSFCPRNVMRCISEVFEDEDGLHVKLMSKHTIEGSHYVHICCEATGDDINSMEFPLLLDMGFDRQ